MKVKGIHYQSIWIDKGNDRIVRVINQNLLPFRFEIEELRTAGDVERAIKEMMVRGAPLIGATAALGLYLAAAEGRDSNTGMDYIEKWKGRLQQTRPTAINLYASLDRVYNRIRTLGDLHDIAVQAREEALSVIGEEISASKRIGEYGLEIIKTIAGKKGGGAVNILTHCNAGWLACIDYGTATAPIYLAHDQGVPVHVWVDETRPRNQGSRLTAWELGQHGVPHTVVVDNAGGLLMQQGKVDLVLVGSDRTTRDGWVVNKIGTYLKALAAFDNNIPFFVALPGSSFDLDFDGPVTDIPVEVRDPEEVIFTEGIIEKGMTRVRTIPFGSGIYNPGFDLTPPRLVSGLITERGICKAEKQEILGLLGKMP